MSSSNDVIGVVIIARHGDREGFYQDPLTYTPSFTSITPLGLQQEFQLGEQLRSLYLESGSPTLIQGISTGLFNQSQVLVRADAGGEGGVILASAIAVTQGLWPATTSNNITLANCTTIIAPLDGYQYVPIESVEPDQDVSLEGFTSCNTFNQATETFYNSALFEQVAAENADFLQSLPPYLDGRPVTLENMWNIFDYMNVQYIHNRTFMEKLPEGYLNRARALANFHEYGVFSSPQIDGIGNIAGRTMLPSIISGFESIANASDPLKLLYEAISYKPFISLFNMTDVANAYPELAGVVEYAAALVYEVREGTAADDPLIRMRFKNGTDDIFKTYNMFGQSGDVPLSLFKSKLEFAAINTTAEWCIACANSHDRGCGTCNHPTFVRDAVSAQSYRHYTTLSPVATGVVGAAVTAAAFLLALTALGFLGLVSFDNLKMTRGDIHSKRPDEKCQ